jgi:hypothetical protein
MTPLKASEKEADSWTMGTVHCSRHSGSAIGKGGCELSDSPAKAPPAAALLGGLPDSTMRTAPQYLPISTESPRRSAALVSHRRKRQVAVF